MSLNVKVKFFLEYENIHLLTNIIIRLIILSESDNKPKTTVSTSNCILMPVFCTIQEDKHDQIL
jgi:hypothetical protein